MKRKALLIGNTYGLPGVKVDLVSFERFLKSNAGGAWYGSEIQTVVDPSKEALLAIISSIKQQGNDFMLVHFSGHGGQELQTVLEINSKGECIYESSLFGLSARQISIFDCCRTYPESLSKSRALNFESTFGSFSESVNTVRQRYDARVMQAIPQQIQMYACAKGQSALDTPEGGIYTSSLLKASSTFKSTDDFKTPSAAHQEAIEGVETYARSRGSKQTPEIVSPRCLSSQQLIISIKD